MQTHVASGIKNNKNFIIIKNIKLPAEKFDKQCFFLPSGRRFRGTEMEAAGCSFKAAEGCGGH